MERYSETYKAIFRPKTKEERARAYSLLRAAGFSPHEAMVMRDWTDSKIIWIIENGYKPMLKW